jgi:hypothetical protein
MQTRSLQSLFFHSLIGNAGKQTISRRTKSKAANNNLRELLLAMPKDRADHLKTLKATRKMANPTKYPPGVIQLQVLGSGGRGAPPALYLFTDQTRSAIKSNATVILQCSLT